MNFDLTDEQKTIQQTANQLLRERLTDQRLRDLVEAGAYDDDLEAELAELGWLGATVAAEEGGGGMGLTELVLLAEALGEAIAPLPFLATAATVLLLDGAGSAAQRDRWIPGLSDGSVHGSVASTQPGVQSLAADADSADLLIAVGGSEARIYVAGEFEATPVETLDVGRRYARVEILGEGEILPGDVEAAWARVGVVAAAESTGLAQRALDLAVDYAKVRHQFGRPIGSFQAVSHRCVEMLGELEGARSAVRYAAWTADRGSVDLQPAVAMAEIVAGEAGWKVPAGAIQVSGGIGFTWEHLAHFLLRRGRVNASLRCTHPTELARFADLTLPSADESQEVSL